jgi:glycosyltransferase involved in cell wall biosynthesis
MASGRPALVSDIPEHQEVITDCRFWSANASVFSLARKIVELVKNPKLLEEAGQKNLQTVKTNYRWEDIAKRTAVVYEKNAEAVGASLTETA